MGREIKEEWMWERREVGGERMNRGEGEDNAVRMRNK